MNSLKHFVEVECGGPNPLLQLKSHFTDESYGKATSSFQKDSSYALNKELPFAIAPNTFDMKSLLEEIKQMDDHEVHCLPINQIVPTVSPVQDSSLANKWLEEIEDDLDVFTKAHALSNNHVQMDMPVLESHFLNQNMGRYAPTLAPYQDMIRRQVIHQKPEDWLESFLSEDYFNHKNGYKINDEKLSDVATNQDGSLNVYNCESSSETQAFWEMAEKEWSRIENMNGSSWEQDLSNTYNAKNYVFANENPLKDHPDALQEGIRRLEAGDVSNAVLFLEAAVQKEPENPEAWFYLGRSQADNEQEIFAISAFERCLALNAGDLKALTSLAVCYTNEGQSLKAIKMLFTWLKSNPNYSMLISEDSGTLDPITNYDDLVDIFLKAARCSTQNIDPDLQDALGILFNLSNEYDKAADCFKTALQIQPENSTLWNKLGATLANGNRSEEALEAYHRALSLRPGYVRTRFNLGVACYNLRAYRESVEHYLSALNLQKNSQESTDASSFTTSQMSETIWPSLKLSLTLLGATHLLSACTAHQLDILNREFNMS